MSISILRWVITICIHLFLGVLPLEVFGQIGISDKTLQQFEDRESITSKYEEIQKLVSKNAAEGIAFFKSYEKAFFAYPEVHAKALIEVAEGYNQLDQYALAHTLIDSAKVLTKDSLIYYEALYNKGRFYYKERAFLNALNAFQKCKAYFQTQDTSFLKKTNEHLVANLIRLGQQYEELNKDSFFLFLLNAEEIVSQPSYSLHPNKVNVLYTLGAHYSRSYDTIKSFQYFDKASQIKVDFETSLLQNIAFEKGLVYGKLGLFDAAMQQYKISLDIATKAKDNYSIYANLMDIGRLFSDIAEYDKAKEYYLQGYELAKKIKNDYLLSNALSDLGHIEIKIRNYEKAIAYYERSLLTNDSLKNKYRILINNLGIAKAKKGLHLYAEAYRYNQAAYTLSLIHI